MNSSTENPIFDWLNSNITTWYLPIVVIIGVTGYALCLLVVIKKQSFPQDVQNWIVAMCITFIYVLLQSGIFDYYIFVTTRMYMPAINQYTCYFYLTANNMGFLMTSWIQTGTSVLRAYATISPLRSKILVTRYRSNCLLGFTCASCLLFAIFNATIFVSYDIQQSDANFTQITNFSNSVNLTTSHEKRCDMRENFIYLDFVIRDALPFIIMTISSALVLIAMRRSFDTNCKHSGRQRRTTIMLLGMNATFLVIQPALNLFHMINRSIKLSGDRLYVILNIIHYLMYLDFATTWIFFFLMGRQFRLQLKITVFHFLGACCPCESMSRRFHENIEDKRMRESRLYPLLNTNSKLSKTYHEVQSN